MKLALTKPHLFAAWVFLTALSPILNIVPGYQPDQLVNQQANSLVTVFQLITLGLLLVRRIPLPKHFRQALLVLFIFIPLLFTFGDGGTQFLLIHMTINCVLSWILAVAILLVKPVNKYEQAV